MRMIDADSMREYWLENGENEFVYDTNAVIESIDEQPTVDAVEVVHGRFEAIRYGYGCLQIATCSVCGEMQGLYINGRLPSWNYCPNCGAKMDGGIADG